MKFFKKKKKTTVKLPSFFLQKFNAPSKVLQKRTVEKISKRAFTKNAPINLLGKLGQISKWLYLTGFLAFIIISFYVLFWTTVFNVQKVLIFEGEEESSNLQIRRMTEPLRNRNIVLFSAVDLENLIKSRIDNVSDLRVIKKYPHTVVVQYDKFRDVANINNLIGRTKVRKSFIINENGLLIQEDKISTALPTITIASEVAFNINESPIARDVLKTIMDAWQYFEEKFNLKVREMVYLPKAKEVRMITERGVVLWIDLTYSYKEQLNKLRNALPKINLDDGSLEYVDLRIQSAEGQKIIYK